jgi:ubiquinone/menaquinone biosynthesis C-methylase UbiE
MNSKKVAELNQDEGLQLPGGNSQLKHLFEQEILKEKHALIIGPATNAIVKRLLGHFSEINIIADTYESLVNVRMKLKENDSTKIKMMDFANTDYKKDYFNLIYSQGSISVPDRKNILKEIKRIISENGLVSVGEIVSLKEPIPSFVKDIWERSGLEPLPVSELKKFYASRGLEIVSEQDLSGSLKDYYEKIRITVSKASTEEKEQNKKYFSQLKHESNTYLKHGGDKYIGFKSLIMRKSN